MNDGPVWEGLLVLRHLCRSTPFATNNAVMVREVPHLRVDWLFAHPELLPFAAHRRQIMDELELDSLFAIAYDKAADSEIVRQGVRLRGTDSKVVVEDITDPGLLQSLETTTSLFLRSTPPNHSRCRVIPWTNTGEGKALFMIHKVFRNVIGREKSRYAGITLESFIAFLKRTPSFTVVDEAKDKLVHVTSHLAETPSEEKLAREIEVILRKAPKHKMARASLLKALSPKSKLYVLNEKGIAHFVRRFKGTFANDNNSVLVPKCGANDSQKIPSESAIVQRCTFLILSCKEKTQTVDWLCSKLPGPPTRDQLTRILKKNHVLFSVSEDDNNVRVVNDCVPESYASVISADLVRILRQNGPLNLRHTHDLFNARRMDCIYLNKNITTMIVEARSDLFQFDGGVLSLAGTRKKAVVYYSHSDIDFDFLCPLDRNEENIYDHRTSDGAGFAQISSV